MKDLIFYKPLHFRFTFLAFLFLPPFLVQAASIAADSTKPSIVIPEREFVLGTQGSACGLNLALSPESLEKNFGVELKTPCGFLSSTAELASWGRWIKGIVVDTQGWHTSSAISTKTTIDHLGRYRIIITLSDRCSQTVIDTLYFKVEDRTRPVMLCESALNLTLPESTEPNSSAVQLNYEYFDKGSKDNCRIIEFKVRRSFYPASVSTMITAGYDTNGDGQLDAADGIDLNEDGDISDPGEFIEKKGARYWAPLQDEVEFFPIDTSTSVSVELWGIDRVGAYNTCKTLVTVSSPTSNEQLLPPRLNLPQNNPLSRRKDVLYPSYPNPVNKEAVIYYDLQQAGQLEFKVFDQQGRNILSKKLDGTIGRNELQIQRHELGAAKGLLYYSLRTAQGLLVQKMMVI